MGVLSEIELRVRNCAQLSIALGPVNMYFAGIALGRKPSPAEALNHFFNHGGRDWFNNIWSNASVKSADHHPAD